MLQVNGPPGEPETEYLLCVQCDSWQIMTRMTMRRMSEKGSHRSFQVSCEVTFSKTYYNNLRLERFTARGTSYVFHFRITELGEREDTYGQGPRNRDCKKK